MRRLSLFAAALLALAGCAADREPAETVAVEMTKERLAEGRQVFVRFCQTCHPAGRTGVGPRLEGRPLPAPIVRNRVRNGMGAMPAFGTDTISDDELDSIVAYVISLSRTGR
jgi:mono/diheme cytochrome c family protein